MFVRRRYCILRLFHRKHVPFPFPPTLVSSKRNTDRFPSVSYNIGGVNNEVFLWCLFLMFFFFLSINISLGKSDPIFSKVTFQTRNVVFNFLFSFCVKVHTVGEKWPRFDDVFRWKFDHAYATILAPDGRSRGNGIQKKKKSLFHRCILRRARRIWILKHSRRKFDWP